MRSLCLLAAVVAVGACASQERQSEPLTLTSTEELAATVEAVDHAQRLVTLRGPGGESQTIEVAPEVRNLAQVEPGNKVIVRYYEGLAAQIAKKGEAATTPGDVDEELLAGRAEEGARPAGAIGDVITTTVVIQAVDRQANTVTFDGPAGRRTVAVKRPEAQKFIGRLKQGDEVDITYVEALAVSVEPAP